MKRSSIQKQKRPETMSRPFFAKANQAQSAVASGTEAVGTEAKNTKRFF
jgi:hypothetical protein